MGQISVGTHRFCSSSFASSSSSSGLRFSESEVGEHAGAELTEERASWEDESGLTAGDAMAAGAGSVPSPRGFWGSHLESRAPA